MNRLPIFTVEKECGIIPIMIAISLPFSNLSGTGERGVKLLLGSEIRTLLRGYPLHGPQ